MQKKLYLCAQIGKKASLWKQKLQSRKNPKEYLSFGKHVKSTKVRLSLMTHSLHYKSMRYLLDTNIFIYSAIDTDCISADVRAILEDYDNVFYMSAESVKELIVAFRNKKLLSKRWKNEVEMIRAIEDEFYYENNQQLINQK